MDIQVKQKYLTLHFPDSNVSWLKASFTTTILTVNQAFLSLIYALLDHEDFNSYCFVKIMK